MTEIFQPRREQAGYSGSPFDTDDLLTNMAYVISPGAQRESLPVAGHRLIQACIFDRNSRLWSE